MRLENCFSQRPRCVRSQRRHPMAERSRAKRERLYCLRSGKGVSPRRSCTQKRKYSGGISSSGGRGTEPWAQYLLGKLYLMGEGVEQDQEVAYGWFQAAAMQGHTYAQFFKERMEQGPPGPPSLMLSATQLLHHMGNIFRDNVPEDSTSTGLHIDHKRKRMPCYFKPLQEHR